MFALFRGVARVSSSKPQLKVQIYEVGSNCTSGLPKKFAISSKQLSRLG